MARDIGEWLEDLGLGKYAEVFAENEIDLAALPLVTEEDLKEIGVTLGARRKLLAAVAQLEPEIKPKSEPRADGDRAVGTEAERRQLTVMFCDLAGSTVLSERLDPEDLRKVLQAYQETCSEIIGRYDGHIAKYIGDGLLVYFGYPQAHEDDAQRAVRAGLEILKNVPKLSGQVGESLNTELSAHLGIHTGLVVAGEMGAGGTREEMAIVGETPNIAARLEGLAVPDSMLISESTHSLTEGLFICEAQGPQSLKGISEPVAVYRVTGISDARSRFEAAVSRGLMPLVGREQEMALLLDRWEQAKEGEGQVVLLSGEAGIGKSRITEMLRDRVAAEHHFRLRYQCSPHHTNSALHPIIDQLERAAGFARDDPSDVRLDKLESLVVQSSRHPAEAVPLLAAVISIPTGDRFRPLELSPEIQKERTLATLIDQMEGLAEKRPVLIIFEDAHWVDPTSQELLDLIVDHAQAVKALVVITHRPVFAAPWGGHPHVTSLTLNRLGRRQSQAMVSALTANKPLPEDVLGQILAKTDGVPLFVEELTRTVLEAGFLREEEDRYVLTGPLPPLAIPATLHDSLMARLDRLSPIKEVAQTAAAIGREFSHQLLSEVSTANDEGLEDALAQLAEAGLVFRRGKPPQATYIFKHALVRDAAYESLLKSKRPELHGRIAQTLEHSFPERAEAEPELLAYHLTEAGLTEPAIAYWRKAGLRAIERSANVEAVAHLTKGLELFAALPDCGERPQDELSLQAPLGSALTSAKGYSAPETGRALTRARDLCREVGDTPQTFEVLYGVWNLNFVAGDIRDAYEIAEECLNMLQPDGERTRLIAAHSAMGQNLIPLGRLEAGQAQMEQSLGLYNPEEDRSLCFVYGEDPALACLNWLPWVLWFRGFPEQAESRSHEALAKCQELSHPLTSGFSYALVAMFRYFRREPVVAREIAQEGIDFCREHDVPVYPAFSTLVRGWALAELDRPESGVADMHDGFDEWRATGTGLMLPIFYAVLAEGYAKWGKIEEGLKFLEKAFDRMRTTGECVWEPELHRLKGVLLLSQSGKNEIEAEARFSKAIEVAREQSAKSFELRAATNLARLWQGQDKKNEARDLLSLIYEWFTEGFQTSDLVETKRLLNALS
jgi:class 3 adenylate cyclase/predicted ATPase